MSINNEERPRGANSLVNSHTSLDGISMDSV